MRCTRTGMFGAAVTTSSIAVGSRCAFVRAGVGAVLTQHRTDPRLGPRGLDLLATGKSAQQALDGLIASDPHIDWREIAIVDADGGVAVFHGRHLRPIYANAIGLGMVAVGNILKNDAVCKAEIEAAKADTSLHICDRLLAALDAGLAAGGEIRPLRSAVMIVAGKEEFSLVDLRVDDQDAPLAALRALWEAYRPQMDAFVERAIDPNRAGPATTSLVSS